MTSEAYGVAIHDGPTPIVPGPAAFQRANAAERKAATLAGWKLRLRKLQGHTAALHSASRNAAELAGDQIRARKIREGGIQQAKDESDGRTLPAWVREAEREVREMIEEEQEGIAGRDRLASAWSAAASLLSAGEEFLESAPLETLAVRLPPLTEIPGDLAGAVNEIRQEIEDLEEERDRIGNLPPSKAEALALVRGRVEGMATKGRELAGGLRRGQFAREAAHWPHDGTLALLCWCNGRDLIEASRAAIEADPEAGVSGPERRKALKDLTAKHEALELSEESLIRAGERRGLPIARRRDADPAIVLRPDAG